MRSVSIRLEDLCKITIPIGFAGENLRTTVRIDCMKMFQDYPDAIATLSVKPPEGKPYPTVVTRDGDIVIWEVTSSDLASQGYGEIQLSFLVDDVVAKSFVGKTRVDKSILPTGQAPDPINDWIIRAEAALEGIPATIQAALEEAKESGEFDGFSPIANVTKEGNIATITITDKEGTTTATVSDGDYTNLIDDTSGSGTTDKTWSANKLTTELTNVNTSLANKEDKPDLIATYTVTLDFMTGNYTATCDKTIEEIGQAYDGGKKIEVIMTVAQMRQKAHLTVMKYGNMYACIAGTTFIAEGTVLHICVYSFSDAEDLHVEAYVPLLSGTDGNYNARNIKITQLANPTASTDAANKGYVDIGLATKEDKPGLTVTFTAVSNGPIIPPGEPAYSIVCDTTDSDIINANDNNVKIKAVVSIDGIQSELPIHIIENIPNMGQFMVFMGTGFDPMMSSGGPLSSSLSTLMIAKLPGAQDWQMKANGISDVQINGTSIVNEIGVANIPVASLDNLGVVKVATNDSATTGIKKNSSGQILLVPAPSANIKTPSSSDKRPIVPNTQHEAAFYGLAKAAGDSTQAASSNAVGTYTDEAKSAIQSMLGVTRIDDTAGTGDTDVTYSADKLATDHGSLLNAINGKQDAPETAGTAGQVLSLDNNLDPVWSTPQSGGGSVNDVQINGTSIVDQGVANIPVASSSAFGAVKVYSGDTAYGIHATGSGVLEVNPANDGNMKDGTATNKPVTPNRQHRSVFFGLSKVAGYDLKDVSSVTLGTYPEESKSAISEMLNGAVSVSGATPSITAKAGVRYICGEVSTLTIVVPSSGCIDVTFTSGSTATVLTVTPPTGMTMKWANGFDPSSLDANTTYEINIMDGCLGVVGQWT